MGNVQGAPKFLTTDPNWEQYVGADWRSDDARELDKLGGLHRPAVSLADTMAAKLGFLEDRLRGQGDDMLKALDRHDENSGRPLPSRAGDWKPVVLHTEIRAHVHAATYQAMYPELRGGDQPQWVDMAPDPVQRGRSLLARQRMNEYAKSVSAANKQGTPVAMPWKVSNGRARRNSLLLHSSSQMASSPSATLMIGDSLSNEDVAASGSSVIDMSKMTGGASQVQANITQMAATIQPLAVADGKPAPWRLRLHHARRRAAIVIRTMIRLKRGLNHPKRMQRVDSFSFYIPLLLGDGIPKFAEAQSAFVQTQEEITNCKVSINNIVEHHGSGRNSHGHVPPQSPSGGSRPSHPHQHHHQHHHQHQHPHHVTAARPAATPDGRARASQKLGPAGPIPQTQALLDASMSPRPLTPSRLQMPAAGTHDASPLSPTQQQQQQQQQDVGPAGGGGGGAASASAPPTPQPPPGYPALPSPPWRKNSPARLSTPGASPSPTAGVVQLPGISYNGRRLAPLGVADDAGDGSAPGQTGGAGGGSLANRLGNGGGRFAGRGSMRQSCDGILNTGDAAASSQKYLSAMRTKNQPPSPSVTAGAERVSPTGLSPLNLPGIMARDTKASMRRPEHRFSDNGSSLKLQAPRGATPGPPVDPPFKKTSGRFSETGGMLAKPQASGPPMDPPVKRKDSNSMFMARSCELSHVTGAESPIMSPRSSATKARRASMTEGLWSVDEVRFQELARMAVTKQVAVDGDAKAAPPRRQTPLQRLRAAVHTVVLAARLNRLDAALGAPGAGHDAGNATQLCWRLDLELIRLKRHAAMLSMFINRCNAGWAERQTWGPPAVWSLAEQETYLASGAFKQQIDLSVRLKRGQVAVQIFGGDDYLKLPNGSSMDLWTSDPWSLVAACRPGTMPLTDRIKGLAMGTRIMMQLALAVEGLAGREALAKMTVVLHINDGQQYEALSDLTEHSHFGFSPERVLITVQQCRPGYRYDAAAKRFQMDQMGARESVGTGYAMAQLCWVGEAFYVTSSGVPVFLLGTLLEHLSANNIEWLVSHRARDLSLLGKDSAVDVAALLFAFLLHARQGATMTLQVTSTDSQVVSRAHDSMVLSHHSTDGGGSSNGGSDASSHPPCVDLRCSELCSPLMMDLGTVVGSVSGSERKLVVGMHRYTMHLPSLRQHLSEMSVFRPKLLRYGASDLVHVTLDMSDVTTAPGANCMAVQSRQSPDMLFTTEDIDTVVPLVLAQDNDASFRAFIARTHTAPGPGMEVVVASSAHTGRGHGKPGQCIVVLVTANDVTQTAINLVMLMARPGRDVVHLVTVVPGGLQEAAGQALLKPYFQQLARSLVETKMEVVVKGVMGLLECLERYIQSSGASLVVMGSKCLTAGALSSAFSMGSLTLSCIKRLQVPMMLVTANSTNVCALTSARTEFRALAVVDIHARSMLSFLSGQCMDPRRGDRLMLAHVTPTEHLTTNQITARRRVMDTFVDAAKSHHMPPASKVELAGPPWEKPLLAYVQDNGVHLIGVQVPSGDRSLPGQVLQLIRSCRGAVLLYRDVPGGRS